MDELPWARIRVADFTWAWAGPYATMLLALMGAEVIKVESRRRPDHSRMRYIKTGPFLGGLDRSPAFNEINLNKLSVALDLKQPKGVELAKRIVRISDVVVENMRPGAMESLGLGYEQLKAVRPDLIMLSGSAVGATGPERSYTGYAPTFCALGGLAHLSGCSDDPPDSLSGGVDTRVATTLAFALLAALIHRERTGQGQYIDVSASEAIACLIGDALMDYSMNRRSPFRMGNRDLSMAPHNCYPCQEEGKLVTIAVASEEEWRALCEAIGDAPWMHEKRFSNAYQRWQNQDELDKRVGEWTKKRHQYEVMETLQAAGVASMPCLDGPELVQDQQLRQRDMFQEVDHPLLGKRIVVGPPWKFSATQPKVLRAAPVLGQHNQYVFGELLGMSSDEIVQLEGEVIY